MKDEDRTWIAQAQAGSREAFGRLVKKYQAQVYGFIFHLVRNFSDAQDLTQETFLKAYRNLTKFREPGNFPGWLTTIARNECRMWQRKPREDLVPSDLWLNQEGQMPNRVDPLEGRPLTPEEIYERDERARQVLSAVNALSEKNRLIVGLYYIDDLSYRDIGTFLDIPISTVKGRLYKARRQLKEEMLNMVTETFKEHQLPKNFPERVKQLLSYPRPLEIEGHPLANMWEEVRACLPDYELVSSRSEIETVAESFDLLRVPRDDYQTVYVDEDRILRSHMTPTLVRALKGRRPPVKLISVGRVFRDDREDASHYPVFHQIEISCVEEGLASDDAKALVGDLLRSILGPVEVRFTEEHWPFVEAGWSASIAIEGRDQEIFGFGLISEAVLRDVGIDPDRYACIGVGIGLERLAMIKYGIKDIREFWRL